MDIDTPAASVRTGPGDGVLAAISSRTDLDGPAEALRSWLLATYDQQGWGVRDLLHGEWLGHPLHPTLVGTTVGSLAATAALDLVGGEARQEAARTTLGFAVLASVATLATGWTDWLEAEGGARRVGLVHGVANELATGLYVVSYLQRRRGKHRRADRTLRLGLAVSGAGAYLGGALAYTYGVGSDLRRP